MFDFLKKNKINNNNDNNNNNNNNNNKNIKCLIITMFLISMSRAYASFLV